MTADPVSAQVGTDAHQQVAPGRQAVIRAHLLEGPIAAQMLRLAWPVLVVLGLQTFVGVAETYFVGFLGADALAGVALVFPIFMLMTMMSNGGIGGGVSSAVARAIGAGRKRDAEALATHAAMLGILFGALFTLAVWLCGPSLAKAFFPRLPVDRGSGNFDVRDRPFLLGVAPQGNGRSRRSRARQCAFHSTSDKSPRLELAP